MFKHLDEGTGCFVLREDKKYPNITLIIKIIDKINRNIIYQEILTSQEPEKTININLDDKTCKVDIQVYPMGNK